MSQLTDTPPVQIRRFRRVLIANRGEIAVRIIRTLRELDIESVAIYSPQDRQSLHCALADYAYPLEGLSPGETYLNIPQIQKVVAAANADAVHPGYGFLSENAAFQEAIASLGKIFIGPTRHAMQLMGDKIQARQLMQAHGIPIVPGLERPLSSYQDLREASREIGFPLILKAAGGGGGRGMRVVHQESELESAFASCTREASAYFGNPAIFCERYVLRPRHIEFQVLFDQYGRGVHFFERDCSLQRRHQKLFEEAPSSYLTSKQREALGELAVKAAKAAQYSGAGTVEFICESPEKAYFMEMNTRIQVEHPVSECVTGFDLIAEQIRIAQGEPLGMAQKDIVLRGWSMEARINAEDPFAGFLPTPGRILDCALPQGPNVRTDTHIYPGYLIPADYDSLLAKVVVWGQNRQEAIRRMLRSLGELSIIGPKTTTPFHEALLQHPAFIKGEFDTSFLEAEAAYFRESSQKAPKHTPNELGLMAALLWQQHLHTHASQSDYQQEASGYSQQGPQEDHTCPHG